MRIWLLEHPAPTTSGTYCSAVVIAENEQEARKIHPDSTDPDVGFTPERNKKAWDRGYGWVESPDKVVVTLLGIAQPALSYGVWCADYYH